MQAFKCRVSCDKMEQPKFMQNRVKLGCRDASRRRISATTEDRGYLPV